MTETMAETLKVRSELTIYPRSDDPNASRETVPESTEDVPQERGFAFLKTRRFYLVLAMGQTLALCLVSTGTFSLKLANEGTSIPAFQSFFIYLLLNLVYTSYTLYKYGLKKWVQLVRTDGWKYFILAFLDVEGNYFAVLAYRYTTMLSAQLINFWTIVVVVILSFLFLRVRYRIPQIIGILLCCGGMGVLLASDSKHSSPAGGMPTQLKGDLFMLLGATMYGFSNVTEEFLASKKPIFEVLGQLGFWGVLISGAQAGIFDRAHFQSATWNGKVAGYMMGFSLTYFIFYNLMPILLRMSSAAFFNISILTTNFWGLLIGVRVFGYVIPKLYPVAFVMVILGLFTYFGFQSSLGEARKPWLGLDQEKGVVGVGTAKKKIRVDVEAMS